MYAYYYNSSSDLDSISSDSDNVSDITTIEYDDEMDEDMDIEVEIDPCYYKRFGRPDNLDLQAIDQGYLDDMIMSSMATVAPFSPVNFNISPLDYGVRV